MKYIYILLLLFEVTFGQETKATFSKEITTKISMQYILDMPKNTKEKLPLIVFLHGSGERGTDLEIVKNHSPFTYKHLISQPVAILAPQCPEGIWWDTTTLYQLIVEIVAKNNIDPKRIYLTGLSMGGWGSWKLASEHPELFAVLAPVCAPVDKQMFYSLDKIKNIPTKIFHGALDDVVPVQNSIDIYQKLKAINPKVTLTIFENDNHNSWDSTYSDAKFYEWMLGNLKI